MTDFFQKANVNGSARTLTAQIADMAALKTLIQTVINTNAFQYVDHRVAGVTHPDQTIYQ